MSNSNTAIQSTSPKGADEYQLSAVAPSAASLDNTDPDGDKILEEYGAQPAQIGPDEADRIDADFGGLSNRRARRAALGMLELSGQQLIAMVTGERETAVATAVAAGAIEAYAERMRLFADMMDSASIRIRLALCSREDMESVLKEAEAELESDGAHNGAEVADTKGS